MSMEPISFDTTLAQMDSDVWSYHIPVPPEVAEQFSENDRRVICTLNEEHSFHCAIMPGGNGTWFITVNKERRKKLGLELGMEVQASLVKDESKYGMPMPEELGALLEMDEEGSHYFHSLTMGKQRSLIHVVGKHKHSDTRLRKALVIVDYLKWSKGKLDYKELNQAFKDSNS